MIAFCVVAMAAASPSGTPAARAQERNRLVDDGGNLEVYLDNVARLNALHSVKRIAGRCSSACTAYLGVRRVCIEPTAEVWFHAAHDPESGRIDPAGSLRLLSTYPANVRRWAIRAGALEQVEWSVARMLTGAELIRLGIPRCR